MKTICIYIIVVTAVFIGLTLPLSELWQNGLMIVIVAVILLTAAYPKYLLKTGQIIGLFIANIIIAMYESSKEIREILNQ